MKVVNKLENDVVIIGSGVAGAISAYKLAQKGIEVIIIEAGPVINRQDVVENFTKTTQFDLSSGFPNESWAPRPNWNGESDDYIKQIGPEKLKIEYLKNLGGTTWHWEAETPRFLPVDFKTKDNYGIASNWPISYDELEPFYDEAEKEMGIAGDSNSDYGSPRSNPFPLPPINFSYSDRIISEKLAKLGINFISKPVARNSAPFQGRSQCQGFGTCSPICPSGAQYSANIHVEKARELGVKILDNSPVYKLNTNKDGNIESVNVVNAKGESFEVNGKIFILAANGIENPKLLLMSANKDYPNGLANGSKQVGRNFCDHPTISCRILMPEPVFAGRGPNSIISSYKFRDGNFRKKRSGFILSVNNKVSIQVITGDLLQKGLKPPFLQKEISRIATRQVEIQAHIEQIPTYKNGIELDWNDLDKSGQPRIKFYYSYSRYEKEGFVNAKKELTKIAKNLKAETLEISQPFSSHHLMGTTKMGDNAKDSVVDFESRSHDHKNLFILGSSTFPSSGAANPTLTIAALSLRASGAISKQLNKS